jgi:hypothetical protein
MRLTVNKIDAANDGSALAPPSSLVSAFGIVET